MNSVAMINIDPLVLLRGVAVGAGGNIVVADTGNYRIQAARGSQHMGWYSGWDGIVDGMV